ncbi:hypothetical protein ABT112_03570 [Streptomyces sp. NPDC002055]|uniref:hypothetical protein n=1 Tax=Streptomyces sp. NPDC002055 TaxID=3154534 RepID=UPI003329F90A
MGRAKLRIHLGAAPGVGKTYAMPATVGNLLDMSRLQTGTVSPLIREADLDEVVPMAVGGVPEGSVVPDTPEGLSMVRVDPADLPAGGTL